MSGLVLLLVRLGSGVGLGGLVVGGLVLRRRFDELVDQVVLVGDVVVVLVVMTLVLLGLRRGGGTALGHAGPAGGGGRGHAAAGGGRAGAGLLRVVAGALAVE